MSEVKYNAIVGQSGGPTSAINATLEGVIRGALDSCRISSLYGAFNGVEGMLNDSICNLTDLFVDRDDELELLGKTPGAALGSCRIRLPDVDDVQRREVYDTLFAFFKKHDIKYFFYIGGNDSMDTVMKLSRAMKYYGVDMRFIGVPKTIDNDLCGTDHTPGFGSAAKYIASTISEIVRDCSVYTVRSVTIVEIMGRDAGWLTAAAAYPSLIENGRGPDYAYFPERPFSIDDFISDIKSAFKRKTSVVVALSEGIRFSNGRYVGESAQSGAADVFGHKYLSGAAKVLENEVRARLGCKVRSFDLSLTQRCAGHMMSERDRTESICVGREAVSFAENGENGVLVCCERSSGPYGITFVPKDIEAIANRVKRLPDNFINKNGNGITTECFEYIRPLIEGRSVDIPYENGIPKHCIIKNTNKSRQI